MTTLTLPATSGDSAARPSARGLGLLLLVEGLLSLAPIVVMGPAIGWPASLGAAPADQLAAIHAHPEAVAWGYGLYLLYSVLVAPVMTVLAARVFGGLQHPMAAVVAGFAALSTLARAIGILRWLTVMPALAHAHAVADPAARMQIEALFHATTLYGGGIGELLGVGLFMALAVGPLCLAAWQRRSLPRPLAALGLLSTVLLLAVLAPALRLPLDVPMAVVVTTLTLWMWGCGIWLLRQKGR
jgi:hypothetical protein